MPRSLPQLDVLVLGDHPSSYLAAAILRQGEGLNVGHAVIPNQPIVDRLVTINPAFFELHELVAPLKKKVDLTAIYGLKFLADDPAVSCTHESKTIGAYIGSFKQIHAATTKLAKEAKVQMFEPDELAIRRLDEKGAEVSIDNLIFHPKLLIVAGELPPPQKQMLGLLPNWESGVLHRYTFLKMKSVKGFSAGEKPVIPMSLDIRGTMRWAWLLPGPGAVQLAVEQPIETLETSPPLKMMQHWIEVLAAHGVIKNEGIDLNQSISLDLPFGGALSQEGVANRALLIGPAGGFYTACAEDIYPNCWSAVHAADVTKKALKEKHVQDALQPYRLQWGATLGDYLRGPQQNLRFLLPLVYRNSVMTARLTEAILEGKSVVR